MSDAAHDRIYREIIRYQKNVAEMQSKGVEQLYFYFPVESDIMTGYGLIIGPKDTPYEGGFYIIKFNFPADYPFSPPKCKYESLSSIRQHPNLYVCGKVCMSIINTWGSHDWKPIKGFEQVLISAQALLKENALDCEPPYNFSVEKKDLCCQYDEIVRWANLKFNVVKIIKSPPVPDEIKELVLKTMTSYFIRHSATYLEKCALLQAMNNTVCTSYFSKTRITLRYQSVQEQITTLVKSLEPKPTPKLKPKLKLKLRIK